jgi:hypothetical protein
MEGQQAASIPNCEHTETLLTPKSSPGASIDLLPEELLVCIFQILVKYDPLAVGRLLFISRYWYHIAQETPALWSRILIVPRNFNDVVKCNRYVTKALTNSANLPLDMTIDLYHLYTYLGSLNVPPSDSNNRELSSLFRHVVGHEGANIVRWRSFRLRIQVDTYGYFGATAALVAFMKGLYYPATHLESLHLHLNSADEHFPPIGGPLQNLRSLKHLTMDAGGHLGYIKCVPERVETLCFRLWNSTKVMSPFINLRELSIASVPNGGITHKDDPLVTFPLLECLTLEVWFSWQGESAAELAQKIRAPLLNTLQLLDDEALLSVTYATAFHHIRALDLLSPGPDSSIILNFLEYSLDKYTSLASLTVCPWHGENVMTRLRSLKDRGQAPVDLDILYTVISNQDGVVLDQDNAKKTLSMWRLVSDYIYRTHTLSNCAAVVP